MKIFRLMRSFPPLLTQLVELLPILRRRVRRFDGPIPGDWTNERPEIFKG